MKSAEEHISGILEIIHSYGCIDGGHHKEWVLNQIVRIATGDESVYNT